MYYTFFLSMLCVSRHTLRYLRDIEDHSLLESTMYCVDAPYVNLLYHEQHYIFVLQIRYVVNRYDSPQ